MYALSDQEVLDVWESGVDQHPVDRALTLLATALPGTDRDRLVGMSVGERDGYLMDVREVNFGPSVAGVAECPRCEELLEWRLDLADIRSFRGAPARDGPHRLAVEGYELSYRLPDSADLAEIHPGGGIAGGRSALLRRCVLEARKDGARVEPTSLPEAVILTLAAEMEARDPQAETLLDFECPACELRWQALFDVLAFLWAEIQVRAGRLLSEVHALARAYGWSETDILAMSPTRRRFYLEAVT
ncbi:MAG TPA: hypothetical protein VK869_08040 [Rubrobacteraceae bacterium]|nr:hypothetical protein [Rubrobacteraceae bacterium]